MNSRESTVFSVLFLCQVAMLHAIQAAVGPLGATAVAYFGSVAVCCIALLATIPDHDDE